MQNKQFSIKAHLLDWESRGLALRIGRNGTERRKNIEEVTATIKSIDHMQGGDFARIAIRFLSNEGLAMACATSQALLWMVKTRPTYSILEDGTLKKVEVNEVLEGGSDGHESDA